MMAATLGRDGRVTYDTVMIDGTIQSGSEGWLDIDGGMLIWGHDSAAGDFDSATFFGKIE